MNCPHCNIPLLMTDRKGVEIDYCSQCRGVWLDRGELDKIIDLSVNERSAGQSRKNNAYQDDYRDQRRHNSYHQEKDHYSRGHSKHYKPYNKYKKKKSLLGEMFDIFD